MNSCVFYILLHFQLWIIFFYNFITNKPYFIYFILFILIIIFFFENLFLKNCGFSSFIKMQYIPKNDIHISYCSFFRKAWMARPLKNNSFAALLINIKKHHETSWKNFCKLRKQGYFWKKYEEDMNKLGGRVVM